jgi:hypothetical protein
MTSFHRRSHPPTNARKPVAVAVAVAVARLPHLTMAMACQRITRPLLMPEATSVAAVKWG